MQLLHRAPHFKRRRIRRQRLPEAYSDVVGDLAGNLPYKASTLEAEDSAPVSLQMRWDNGRIHVFHDALHAAAERKHLPDAGDLAFGEDTDDLSLLNGFARSAQSANHLTRTELRRNRNRIAQLGQRLDEGKVINVLEHDEAHEAVGGSGTQKCIHERKVVADKECNTLGGNILEPFNPDTINRARGHPQQQPYQGLRQ